jgi:hypothetical protein
MIIFLLWSCTLTCEEVCTTISSCDNISQENTNTIDCTSACLSQQEQAEEEEQSEAFGSLKSCLNTSTCAEIEAGVCYDEDLYSW